MAASTPPSGSGAEAHRELGRVCLLDRVAHSGEPGRPGDQQSDARYEEHGRDDAD